MNIRFKEQQLFEIEFAWNGKNAFDVIWSI